jgi:hypothetical protein
VLLGGGSGGVVASLFTHGIALPHLVRNGSSDLVDRYVRPTLAGQTIGALAVTEPDGGSDVAGLRTRAVRDGDSYVVNGAKTYITSGVRADFVTTAVRTGGPGHQGISLLVVDRGAPGFTVSRRLDKMGWRCSDTAELSFADVRVPAENLGGRGGQRVRADHAAVPVRAARARGPGLRHRAALPGPHRAVGARPRDLRATARVAAGGAAQGGRDGAPGVGRPDRRRAPPTTPGWTATARPTAASPR